MENLIKENIEVGAPANPVIVQNVASLPGGVEVGINSIDYGNYPGGIIEGDGANYPKVLKAGHIVFQTTEGTWISAVINEEGVFASCAADLEYVPSVIGVITEDAPVYEDGYEEYYATCSIMLIGIVDAKQTPAKLSSDSIYNNNVYNNGLRDPHDACHIAFINR